jgi:hypothetical protein
LRKVSSDTASLEELQAFSVRLVPEVRSGSNCLDRMTIHAQADRKEDRVLVPAGTKGHIAYGPYEYLRPGRYAILLAIGNVDPLDDLEVAFDVVANDREFAAGRLRPNTAVGLLKLEFHVTQADLGAKFEYRVWTNGKGAFTLESIAIERTGD